VVAARTVVLSLIVGVAGPASGFVLGGGIANKDCRVAFGGVDPTEGASQVLCTDGDSCDADGTVDGSCRFDVALCTGVPVSGCAPREVTALEVAGYPLESPALPSVAGACGAPSEITLPATGGETGVSVVAHDGRALKDVDFLNLCCRSGPTPFDTALCALAALPDVACRPGAVPDRKLAPFARARGDMLLAAADPARARVLARKAVKELKKVKRAAKRISRRDSSCGFVMGLVASGAIETVRASIVPAGRGRQAPRP
jgi:hypothetical protein